MRARKKKHLMHGATYPEKLCDRLIKMYSNKDDVILDPFLGTGTTVLAAIKAKRNAIGIELTERFFSVAEDSISKTVKGYQLGLFETLTYGKYKLYKGDCSEVLKQISNDTVQITITSPPYADLIHKVVEDRR